MKKRTSFVNRHLSWAVILIWFCAGICVHTAWKSLTNHTETVSINVRIITKNINERIINAKQGDKLPIYILDKKQTATVINNDPEREVITISCPSGCITMKTISGEWVDVPTEFEVSYNRMKKILLSDTAIKDKP